MTIEPPPKVKVCGITRWQDAASALQLGADYIGMILYPKSPRAVERNTARDLCNRIPAGKRVFVDVATGTDELEDYADLGFDYFQIHCDPDTAWSTLAGWSGIVGRDRLWLAPKIPPDQPFPQTILEFADTVLVDTYRQEGHGGSGQTGDWQRFRDWSLLHQHKHWVLAGGLNPSNIREALAQTGARRVDVNSGVEHTPGIKDPAKLAAFFAAL